MRARNVHFSVWSMLAVVLLAGCAGDPEQAVIGSWKGDDSAAGVAMRAAKLKGQAPDAESSELMAAARAMGNVGLELRKDKTFDLLMGGNTVKGDWAFDQERAEVRLDAKTAEVAPENADKNPGPFKPTTFVAYLNESGNLRLYPMPREAYDLLKQSGNAGKVGFVLYKK